MVLDGDAGLGYGLAGDVDHAVLAEVERAVGADQVLAGDRLGPGYAGKLHAHGRIAEPLAEPLVQGRADILDGHAGHADGAVDRPQVDRAFGLDHVVVVDGLVGQGVGADLQHIEDLGPIGRQGDELEHFDLDHVRGLDAIGRQRHLVHFTGRLEGLRHGRFQLGIVGVDGTATGQEQHGEPDGREGRSGKAGDSGVAGHDR